jgi:hypothetical protein
MDPLKQGIRPGSALNFTANGFVKFTNSQPPAWSKLLWPGDRAPARSTQHRMSLAGCAGKKHQGGQVPPGVDETDSARRASAHGPIAGRDGAAHLSNVGAPFIRQVSISCRFHFRVQHRFAQNRPSIMHQHSEEQLWPLFIVRHLLERIPLRLNHG